MTHHHATEYSALFLYYALLYISFSFFYINSEFIHDFASFINKSVYSHLYDTDSDSDTDSDTDSDIFKDMPQLIENVRYEDKYIEEVRNMSIVLFTTKEINDVKPQLSASSTDEEIEKYALNVRHKNLKKCFVIEKTPIGNVAMLYNNEKEAFEYYSDNTIPYRFLETVCRKYIKTYHCKELYIDMQDELKQYEERVEEKKKSDIERKEREKEEQEDIRIPAKKNVFANFKSYNKEAGNGRVNKAPPPKNSGVRTIGEENREIQLKDHANHYTCIGRFSNFNILQKVDKKEVNKNYSVTFSEFKKMQNTNKNYL